MPAPGMTAADINLRAILRIVLVVVGVVLVLYVLYVLRKPLSWIVIATFLAARIERLELDGDPLYGGVTGIYGLDRLPIRFSAA